MTLIQAIILGLVQGATEFIPVSSSGHVELVPWLLGWDPPGLTFTVVIHVGTSCGVLLVFWRDWLNMAKSGIRFVAGKGADNHARLLWLLILGSIPAGIVGLILEDLFEAIFQKPFVAALMLFVTAILLVIGEKIGRLERTVETMTWKDSLIIGVAQTIAIMPGISRSGSTIAAGRVRHLKREDAARFSFLLSTPIIIAAGLLQLIKITTAGVSSLQTAILVAGFLVSFASAYLVINWMLRFLKTRSTIPFAVYCVCMAVLCLVVYAIRLS